MSQLTLTIIICDSDEVILYIEESYQIKSMNTYIILLCIFSLPTFIYGSSNYSCMCSPGYLLLLLVPIIAPISVINNHPVVIHEKV